MGNEVIDTDSLRDLNKLRKLTYRKDPAQEDFLLALNKTLMAWEVARYGDHPEEHPFVFVFGLPRSGTTLVAQVLAYCFDVGYINNLAARFWLAPVTGVRLSRILLENGETTDFQSRYAATRHLGDIHEFGYFWRHWLKKETVSDIVNARAREPQIDWRGLKRTLLNIQHEFDSGMVFKNIFGAYHIERFIGLLTRALFVYVERDPLDVAISILDARKQFYQDLNTWWSTYPPEFGLLKDLPYMEQIGGQVFYLRRLYEAQIRAVEGRNIARISYRDLCLKPLQVLDAVNQACERFCGCKLKLINEPPAQFVYREYTARSFEREQFERILESYATSNVARREYDDQIP